MGRVFPAFVVFVLLAMKFHIFREITDDGYRGIVLPTSLFLLSTFFLMSKMNIYPKSLRKMGWLGQNIIEYLIACFLMECLVVDFWIPMEIQLLIVLAKLSMHVEYIMHHFGILCGRLCYFIGHPDTGVGVSLLLSIFFFLAVLQATRTIDFGLLRTCGPKCFFDDIIFRFKWNFKKNILRSKGVVNKRRVQMTRSASSDNYGRRRRTSRTHPQCRDDECELSSEEYCPYHGEMYDDDLGQTFSDFEMTVNDDYYD